MKIGIVGTGHIGKILVQRLSAAGHQIKVANSRGPETIESEILSDGAQAVSAAEVVKDVETLILYSAKPYPGYRAVASFCPRRHGGHRHVELLSGPRQ
jgi:predicted dinucleotide-binding enzyme